MQLHNIVARALLFLLFLSPTAPLHSQSPERSPLFDVAPKPPQQPRQGPGGALYPNEKFRITTSGEGDGQYWIFEPAAPAPKSAPVIIFLHGWSAMNPNAYGAWIEHLARRGNIVIYPRYQATVRTPMTAFTGNAIAAIKSALADLNAGDHVRPQLDHIAAAGHSMGAAMVANLAALASQNGLPQIKAMLIVEPGDGPLLGRLHMPRADLSRIPSSTLALVVVGQDDLLARDLTANRIYSELVSVPPENRNYLTLVSDRHGWPGLIADHMAPAAVKRLVSEDGINPLQTPFAARYMTDALDYYGCWKLLDGLTDAAFFGRNREYALGNTQQQRYMGAWSDGTPVKELLVRTN